MASGCFLGRRLFKKGSVLRFLVPIRDQVAKDAEQRAYLANYESVPWICRNAWSDGEFTVRRTVEDSGYLHFPWRSEKHGVLMLSTATLAERDEPYSLALELARGTTYRLRQQLNDWLDQGLLGTADAASQLKKAVSIFSRAATSQSDHELCHILAADSIEMALDVCGDLVGRYVDQVLEVRHRNAKQFSTLFGVNVGSEFPRANMANQIVTAFNTAILPMHWREIEIASGEFDWTMLDNQIEWAQGASLKTIAGPLTSLNQMSVPDWLYLWEGDVQGIASFVGSFVTKVAERYKDRVNLWHCVATRVGDERLGLSEDERLRILVTSIEALRAVDAKKPIMVSFDQPWSDHVMNDDENSPWVFADALVRSNLNLSAIGLEFNFGYQGGCTMRDQMEISRRLDGWSTLGVPIIAYLTFPSAGETIEKNLVGSESVGDDVADKVNESWQSQQAVRMARLLLSKRTVQGIVWSQWSDATSHRFPNGGLIDSEGGAKPTLDKLRAFRTEHLT